MHGSVRGSEAKAVEHGSTAGPSTAAEAPTTTETGKVLKARKRTKTGCLTCRKRRIKCGEERPTCKNCTKSKRECEGYIPRVVFKDPVGGYEPSVGSHGNIYNQQAYGSNHPAVIFGNVPPVSTDGVSFTAIAPRPSLDEGHNGTGPPLSGAQYSYGDPWMPSSYLNQPFPQSTPSAHFPVQQIPNGYGGVQIRPDQWIPAHHELALAQQNIQFSALDYSRPPEYPGTYPTAQPHPADNVSSISQLNPSNQFDYYAGAHVPNPSELTQIPPNIRVERAQELANYQAQHQNQFNGLPSQQTSWQKEPDDTWFDVESDEEDDANRPEVGDAEPSDLGLMLAISANQREKTNRSIGDFLDEPNILAAYNPPYTASPLMDPQTARVFCHFITSTGPTLSVCERHPSNPSVIFSGRAIPKSQQALWSYTMPMLALKHQGLLHAMLALASLHISKLQQSSPTPSLRHYHYALRRVAKALADPKKKRETATLAATLLLGYYEVTTAEHNKWNSHLSGARELIMDIPFASMSRRVEAQRRRQEEEEAKMRQMHGLYNNGYSYPSMAPSDLAARSERQLDENLIGIIMGWTTRYNEFGQIVDDGVSPELDAPVTPTEMDDFESKCDLFWWYAKQDTYQSIVSGNRLLLSYERWGYCPPRAPIGRLDAVYGSMDHMYLLMARLADFSGKDISRKKRATREAEKKSKTSSEPSTTASGTTRRTPPMYGMMPDHGPVRLPRGFDQAKHDRIYTTPPSSETKPLETAFDDALAEWNAISHAFDVLFEALGPAFAPLAPEHMTPLSTPFGPAIYYRSWSIACVLCMYNCGRMILQRVHPSMPPAAMSAIGAASPKTAQYANTIGRISAGIQPVSQTAPLNPHHGAALMDVCMSLFNAGVQFRDPAQRGWTILKLRDVARLTGWQTSALIASGCERAWIRAAEMGKGPPYERTMSKVAKDDRVSGRSRDPRMMANPPKDNNDRRFVHRNAGTRVYWAMGILSVEEDMKDLSLGER